VIARTLSILVALALLLPCAGSIALAGAMFWVLTGNDTGGIIEYSPELDRTAYHQMAAEWCARWSRLSHITSMHLRYGDYVSFVCIDKPWMIH
jgi:hypothetical protein